MTSHATFQTPRPTCPHCGHQLNEDEFLYEATSTSDLYEVAVGDDTALLKCPACDREYWVKGGYVPHYTSAYTEDELL